MDFIERIFGFSPDGGDGTLELLLFAIPIMGLVILAAWRQMRRVRRPRRSLADDDLGPPQV